MKVTQNFDSADLSFYKNSISEDDINDLIDSLNQALTGGKYNCVHRVELQQDPDGDDFLTLRLCMHNDSYYSCECDYTPGYPARTYGDPYYCYPADPGSIECYSDTKEMLDDVWGCPPEWDYEVDDEDMETEEYLWEKIGDDEGPDPDEAYERWRDEGY